MHKKNARRRARVARTSPKAFAVAKVMDMLEGSYTSQSAGYKIVEKGMYKLTNQELSTLYAMLLCEIKVTPLPK